MEKTLNIPIAKTFGWLHANGTKVNLSGREKEITLEIPENQSRTVVLEEDIPSVMVSATVAKEGCLKLIQLRRGGSETQGSDIRIRCGENARFEWYRVLLGGSETYDNCSVVLEGNGSSFDAEIGYQLKGNEKLDINCEAIHTGKKTVSCIHASGVLSGRARKILRGTIDLRTGCSGAEGNETEDVLLLDDTVQNLSVPVILCAEEDVVGNHGATIGRLDEALVFYLESRGMTQEEVTRMMAQARLDTVIRKLPDEKLRRELLVEENE